MKPMNSLRSIAAGIALFSLAASSGCLVTAIPAGRMPANLLAKPRADKEQLNLIKLRQDPPAVYQLGPRDILGIYIEGVLGQADQPPPVHSGPDRDLTLPPAIGFPIPIREDGTLSLPLISPIKLSGLTLTQAEDEIRRKYIEGGILLPGKDRIIVTLMRKRTYQILVVREDLSMGSSDSASAGTGTIRRGTAKTVDLKAYENDVLHALSETGGLPGLDAKNEVTILRGQFADATGLNALLADYDVDDQIAGVSPDNPNLVRIPLRRGVNDPPINIDEEDIILGNGDILLISTREREVFYTGGVLMGREHLLPRDYDLDVLGAIALSGASLSPGPTGGGGGSMGSMGGMGGGGLSSGRGLIPPTDLVVVRKTRGGYQIPIRVNIHSALSSPAERILIQPGDLIILQYKPVELIGNMMLNNIQVNYFLNKLQ